MTAPHRIEYRGPEGWTVWMDEDGVHLRSRSGDNLEASDLGKLISLIDEAAEHRSVGTIPAPKPPTREEALRMFDLHREEYTAKRAARAVHEALSPETDQPF